MSVLPTSQNKRRALYSYAIYGAIGLLAALAFASRAFGFSVHLPAMLIVAGVGVLSVLQFNALDEVAKQAHYVAWYWGGLVGLSAMAVIVLALAAAPEGFAFIEQIMAQWSDGADAETSFLFGLMVTPTLMMLGFAGWWAVFWLRRR